MKNFFLIFPTLLPQFRIKFFFKIAIIEQNFFTNIEASSSIFFSKYIESFFFV